MRITSGIHKNRLIISPKGDQTRPTSSKLRSAFFNICQLSIQDAYFLDLFAGTGAIGLEALSRGANQVVFVDKQRQCTQCIQENLRQFNEEARGTVLCMDVLTYLEKFKSESEKFTLIYADPPYNTQIGKNSESLTFSEKVLSLVDEKKILQPNGFLYLEDSTSAFAEIKEWGSLKLKSVRHFGHSQLLEYQNI